MKLLECRVWVLEFPLWCSRLRIWCCLWGGMDLTPSPAQWVKDLVLPYLWVGRSQLWLRFNSWPRNFHMPWVWSWKKKSVVLSELLTHTIKYSQVYRKKNCNLNCWLNLYFFDDLGGWAIFHVLWLIFYEF